MEFEFDPLKSEQNKLKHGIDFFESQLLWSDPFAISIPAKTSDEVRFLLIGRLDSKMWSAVYTIRDEKIRIISVRRTRKNEEEIYNSF
ncbi:MAG: BrnT family toxin [Bacteroidetes bacterium]|nr:BrnT family toxin [Bacteroidota bacterium]